MRTISLKAALGIAKSSISLLVSCKSISSAFPAVNLLTKSGSVMNGEDMPTISAYWIASMAFPGELIPPVAIITTRPFKWSWTILLTG